jgi:hypothetical protein
MALFPEKTTKSGFIAVWILGGIARQIGFDAKSGALNARILFKSWMQTKWQRLPSWVRADIFHLVIPTRTAWKGVKHTGRTFKHGVQMGVIEGQHRHREWRELREMYGEFPGRRNHPHRDDKLAQIKEARRERWTEHQIRATDIRLAARKGEKLEPLPLRIPPKGTEDPTQPTVADPVRAVTHSPKANPATHPGAVTMRGDWQTTCTLPDGTQYTFDNRNRQFAEREAEYTRKMSPGATVTVAPMPDRLERFRRPGGSLHFGSSIEDPTGVRDCTHCGGAATVDGEICPSCLARADIRNTDWDQRQTRNPGCPGCAHNH